MAEALAVIGSIASVLQVVDFCTQCVSKSVELYRSGSGILDENAAIELAADHLNTLHGQITLEANRTADVSLQQLCTGVAQASAELLGVLTKLKIQGHKTKWKTMRKAIRSVWSEEMVRDLERRLSSFRDELNLHITVKIRHQLESLGGNIEAHFKASTDTERRILQSIVQQRSVFDTALQNQTVLIQTVSDETKRKIEEGDEATRVEIKQAVSDSAASNHAEHEQTRQEIQAEGSRIAKLNQEASDATLLGIQSAELEIVNTVNATSESNQAEHNQTQLQIAQLQQALKELSEQMEVRNQELKDTLAAFQSAQNKTTKKQLYDRSKLVTVALLALETMYRNLKAVLLILQSRAKDLLANAQASEFWAISQYARRVSSSQTNRGAPQQPTENGLYLAPLLAPNALVKGTISYAAHDIYFGYFYTGAADYGLIIDADAMEDRWRFRHQPGLEAISKSSYDGFVIDESPCTSGGLWLLASITLALETHLSPDDSAFMILSAVLDKVQRRAWTNETPFSNGPFTARLKADIGYWSCFAKSRGLLDAMQGGCFELSSITDGRKEDLCDLLSIFLKPLNRSTDDGLRQRSLFMEDGPAQCIAQSLVRTGLPLTIESDMNSSELTVSSDIRTTKRS